MARAGRPRTAPRHLQPGPEASWLHSMGVEARVSSWSRTGFVGLPAQLCQRLGALLVRWAVHGRGPQWPGPRDCAAPLGSGAQGLGAR